MLQMPGRWELDASGAFGIFAWVNCSRGTVRDQ